jgi:hypothetical protein
MIETDTERHSFGLLVTALIIIYALLGELSYVDS